MSNKKRPDPFLLKAIKRRKPELIEVKTQRDLDFHDMDLRNCDFSGLILAGSEFVNANLKGARFRRCDLHYANFAKADLDETDFRRAGLFHARFCGAKMRNADLTEANLDKTDFSNVNLSGATLVGARLLSTKMNGANLSGCHIYGLSAWDIQGKPRNQKGLVVSPEGHAIITVPCMEMAQAIHLLGNDKRITDIIETFSSKVVLILGNFSTKRKKTLDALRTALSERDLTPIEFDFKAPSSRDLIESVSTMAHLAKFVITDLTEPKVVLQELQSIVPLLPSLPIQPIIRKGHRIPETFEHYSGRENVMKPFWYESIDHLLKALDKEIIAKVERRAKKIAPKRR